MLSIAFYCCYTSYNVIVWSVVELSVVANRDKRSSLLCPLTLKLQRKKRFIT